MLAGGGRTAGRMGVGDDNPAKPIAPLLLAGGANGASSRPKPLAPFELPNGAAFAAGARRPAPVLTLGPATEKAAVELAAVELGLVTGVLHADKKSLSMNPSPCAELDEVAEGTAGTASSQSAPATAPLALVLVELDFWACRRSSILSNMARKHVMYLRKVGAVIEDVVSSGVSSGTRERAVYAALLLPPIASHNCTSSCNCETAWQL